MDQTCLIAILILSELMLPSINTFSLSFRLITIGVKSNSLLTLKQKDISNLFNHKAFLNRDELEPREATCQEDKKYAIGQKISP